MHLTEKLCGLCADDTDVSIPLENLGNLLETQQFLLTNIKLENKVCICNNCFSFLGKIQKFTERCNKAHHFLQYLRTLTDVDELKVLEVKKQFGLESDLKSYRSTEIIDQELDIKNESFDQGQVEALEDHDFDELEDFCEISTIALPDENCFVIKNVTIDSEEKPEVKEQSSDEKPTREHDDEATLAYLCHICNTTFKNFLNLQNHCRKEHETNPQVVCSCGSILTSKAQIHLHQKLHKSEKVFACKQCDKVYAHQQSLHNHTKKSHPESEKLSFLCSQCPKSFDSEKKLKVHEQVHMPDDKKMIHPCPYCEKRFTKSVNVQAHVRSIHQMERPFLCSDCGKNFSTKGALKEHQIIHSDIYPYQCSFCPKKFKNLPRLKTHEDIHNNTQYICNICGISLNTKRTLKMHMVVHSDHKKYKCQYCGSSFKRSKALKNHLILHSGLRPYSCIFCSKTFANGSNCRSHKKKAHPAELAALEASGKSTNSAPNIPRLEQLQPKNTQVEHLITVDGSSNVILQQLPLMNSEMKEELEIVQVCENFQPDQTADANHTVLSSILLDPQSHS